MNINLGDFGFKAPPAPEGTRAPARAFVKADHLADDVQQAAFTVLKTAQEQEALEQRQRQASELQDNIGRATLELGELEVKYENDPEFKTSQARFRAEAQKLREAYAASIGDQVVRSAFGGEFQKIAGSREMAVLRAADKKRKDYDQASLERSLSVFADEAAKATTPEDRDLMMRQAGIAITAMQNTGSISAEEAVKKQQGFLQRMDDQLVRRDIGINPSAAADRLALDPEYAKNLAPEVRQRWVDTAYRRSETERARLEADERKRAKQRGDDLMKEALNRSASGTLTAEYVEQVRPLIDHAEYRSLLKALAGDERKDDPTAYAELQGLIYSNPAAAERRAMVLHRNGHIRNETLSSVLGRAREISRQEGPRTEYERTRQYITSAIKPSEFVPDAAGSARYAVVIREFDDFVSSPGPDGKQRTDKEIREKGDALLKFYTQVDMIELAKRTGIGARPTPEQQLEAIEDRTVELAAQRTAGKITQQEFNRKAEQLRKARTAAEKAREVTQRQR